jgi:hypothetical protein
MQKHSIKSALFVVITVARLVEGKGKSANTKILTYQMGILSGLSCLHSFIKN